MILKWLLIPLFLVVTAPQNLRVTTQPPKMAAPTWQASDSQANVYTASTATDLVVNKPTNLVEGDLIIVIIASTLGMRTVTPATDFQLIRSECADTSSNFRPHSLAYWKVATGSEPSTYTFSRSDGTSAAMRISAHRVTGYRLEGGTPIDQQNGANSGSGTGSSLDLPSIDPDEADTLLVVEFGANGAVTASSITEPTDTTIRVELEATPGHGVATQALTTGDATGTKTWSWSSNVRRAGIIFNIFPAGGSSPQTITSDGAASATAESFDGGITPGGVTVTSSEVASASAEAFNGSIVPGGITLTGTTAEATAAAFDGELTSSITITGDPAIATASAFDGSITPGGITITGETAEAIASAFGGFVDNGEEPPEEVGPPPVVIYLQPEHGFFSRKEQPVKSGKVKPYVRPRESRQVELTVDVSLRRVGEADLRLKFERPIQRIEGEEVTGLEIELTGFIDIFLEQATFTQPLLDFVKDLDIVLDLVESDLTKAKEDDLDIVLDCFEFDLSSNVNRIIEKEAVKKQTNLMAMLLDELTN